MHFLQKKTNQQKVRRKFSLMSGPKQNVNKNLGGIFSIILIIDYLKFFVNNLFLKIII